MSRPIRSFDETKLSTRPSTPAIVRQNVTKCGAISHDLEGFIREHPLQYRAAMMMGEGMTLGDVARELEVVRMTIYRWMEQHPEMLVIRDMQMRAFTARVQDRLDELAAQALRKLEHEMELGSVCARWATMTLLRCFDRLPKLYAALHVESPRTSTPDRPASAGEDQTTERALPGPDAH